MLCNSEVGSLLLGHCFPMLKRIVVPWSSRVERSNKCRETLTQQHSITSLKTWIVNKHYYANPKSCISFFHFQMAQRYPLADQCVMFDERTNRLRWFMLPSEAQDLLLGNSQNVKHDVPFDPVEYCGSRGSVTEGHPLPLNTIGTAHHNIIPCTDPTKSESVMASVIPAVYPPLLSIRSASGGSLNKLEPKSHRDGQSPVHFAVGEVMNPAAVMTKPPPAMTQIITNELYPPRTRCHSLGSSSGIFPGILIPQTVSSLSAGITSAGNLKQQQCSCSSQTELNSLEMDSLPSINLLQFSTSSTTDCSTVGRFSPSVSSVSAQSQEDLHAYVKEVTKELATEIKSEIREVISKVEDVLSESTDSSGETGSSFHQQLANSSLDRLLSGSSDCARSNSLSTNDIADYLMEVSREMASEVKSEIREMVNAVDVLISPDVHSREEKSSADSPIDTPGSYPGIAACLSTKLGELSGERTQSSECSSDETVIHTLSIEPKTGQAAANGTEATETEEDSDVTASSKQCCQMRSTINSISSQDSGINLTFQESDSSSHGTSEGTGSELASGGVCKMNSLSDYNSSSCTGGGAKLGTSENQLVSAPSDCASGACFMSQETLEVRAQQDVSDTIKPACKGTRWHCPPKAIWKPAVEVQFYVNNFHNFIT